MTEYDSLIKKVKDLEFKRRELELRIPKLTMQVNEKASELSTLNHHLGNVMTKMDSANQKMSDDNTKHEAWIKETNDELVAKQAEIDKIAEQKAKEFEAKESELGDKATVLEARADNLEKLGQQLVTQKTLLNERDERIEIVESGQAKAASSLRAREETLEKKNQALDEAKALFDKRVAEEKPKLDKTDELHEEAKRKEQEANKMLEQQEGTMEELEKERAILDAKQRALSVESDKLEASRKKLEERQAVLRRNLARISSI